MKISPQLSRTILQGRRKLVVWGGRREFTFYEWQRQIPAQFVVDLQWEWWNRDFFHGLPVYSPGEIASLDPDKTIVLNNYYYSHFDGQIKDYLKRLGGYQAMPPFTLHEMACAASEKEPRAAKMTHGAVENINAALKEMLVVPAGLHKPRRLPKPKELMDFFGSYTAQNYLAAALPLIRDKNTASYRPHARHACLMTNRLSAAGSERQLCNLAVGLKRAGWKPTVLVLEPEESDAINRRFLDDSGIRHITLCSGADPKGLVKSALGALHEIPHDVMMALWHVRAEFALGAAHLYRALRQFKPELLIGFTDKTNSSVAVGGMLAGVPRILLSGRHMAPSHLEIFEAFSGSYRDIYRIALDQPGIFINNNSSMGARSYGEWLRMPSSKIDVVSNSITEEFNQSIDPYSIEEKRQQLGLRKNRPLILGVFRFSPEKRPLDFIRVIAALHKKHLRLRAVICGQGPLEADIRALIHKLKLDEVITLAGAARDIPVTMSAATLLLHTAEIEGFPNVILEAQAVGLPVVCTRGGGTLECLADPLKPYARQSGDIKGLTDACDRLLKQPKLRRQLSSSIRVAIRRHNSIERMAAQTLKCARSG